MKTTTHGIGIHKLAVTTAAIILTGNKEFQTWTKGGVRLIGMRKTGDNQQVFTFKMGTGPVAAERGSSGVFQWMRGWTKARPHGPLAMFGATEPLKVHLTEDRELVVVLPAADKCVPLRQSVRGKSKAKSPELPLSQPTIITYDEEMQAEAQKIVDQLTQAPAGAKAPATTVPNDLDLREAIKVINDYKVAMGDDVVMTVTAEGRLRVLVEYE